MMTPMSCSADPGQKIVFRSSDVIVALRLTPDAMRSLRPTSRSMATIAPIFFCER